MSTFEQRLLPYRIYLIMAALGVVLMVVCFTGWHLDHKEPARVVGFLWIPITLALLALAVVSKRLNVGATRRETTASDLFSVRKILVLVAGGVAFFLMVLLGAMAIGSLTNTDPPEWNLASLALSIYITSNVVNMASQYTSRR